MKYNCNLACISVLCLTNIIYVSSAPSPSSLFTATGLKEHKTEELHLRHKFPSSMQVVCAILEDKTVRCLY